MNLHILKMSQLYCSASSRCFIFSVIISVLICQGTARHRFNHNNLLREQELRDRSFEKVKKELPKLLRLFLKPSSIHRHESDPSNYWSLEQETPPPNVSIKINTSCGRINCENFVNYPLKLIQNLLAEQTSDISQEAIPASADDEYENTDEAEESKELEIARSMGRSYDPSSWLYPNEYPDENNIPRNKYECKLLADAFREEQVEKYNEINQNKGNLCEHKINVTTPTETIDQKMQRFTLVNDNTFIVIKGYECAAGLDCEDPSISINYTYHCSTHWSYRNLCGLNDDKTAIVQKNVAIADGCECKPKKIVKKKST